MISLETAEKILIIRDYIADKKGIKMGFQETINHMMDELVEKENILDELHKYKKKNSK
jgi:DNA integrity scanning protein DisA with diadenylate cyclase activity